jgi:hypothetical protein
LSEYSWREGLPQWQQEGQRIYLLHHVDCSLVLDARVGVPQLAEDL